MATPKFESATECRLHAIALGMTGPESTVFVEKHRSPDWTTWADGKWKRVPTEDHPKKKNGAYVLLGERGQGKTRLLRTMVGLLDEWTPVIAGSDLGEHPFDPITVESRRRTAEEGDALPVAWRHRSDRYAEKLATPDTSVADLIGDVDPMKVAEGRSLGEIGGSFIETIEAAKQVFSHSGVGDLEPLFVAVFSSYLRDHPET